MLANEEKQRQLIDAINLICSHVESKLPPEYTIRLDMSSEEAELSLYGPDGGEIGCDEHDWGVSVLDAMCEVANELEKGSEE